MVREFRDFALRGNVVDLAVAAVIGAAFGRVVASSFGDINTPIIEAIDGQPDFSALTFEINDSVFRCGEFLKALLSFLLIAATIFFLDVTPMNELLERFRKPATAAEPTTRKCPQCMSDIPIGARRSAFCTTVLEQGA